MQIFRLFSTKIHLIYLIFCRNQFRFCAFLHEIQNMLQHTLRMAFFIADTSKANHEHFMLLLSVHLRHGGVEFMPRFFHQTFDHHPLFLQAGNPFCTKGCLTNSYKHMSPSFPVLLKER